MKWLETTVNTTHEAADIIAEIFFSMGCQGVSVADKNDIKDALKNNLYWDYVDPEVFQNSADCVKVASFFLEDEYAERAAELREKLEEVRKNFEACGGQDGEGCGSLEITARLVDDADWENNWKKYYKPIVVGGIQILPEWLLRERREGLLTVALDPGMAFGTGEHETTKMCLELMQSVPLKGKVLFDIGCGSGILGIAAAKLGAAEVFMTDIDPTSVLTAKKNAEKNGVLSAVRIERADLLSSDAEGNKSGVAEKNGVLSAVRIERADLLSGNAEENKGGVAEKNGVLSAVRIERTDLLSSDAEENKSDIIAANITADILIRLADVIDKYLKNGGIAIISGVIKERKKQVNECYIKKGFKLLTEIETGDWCAIKFVFDPY